MCKKAKYAHTYKSMSCDTEVGLLRIMCSYISNAFGQKRIVKEMLVLPSGNSEQQHNEYSSVLAT